MQHRLPLKRIQALKILVIDDRHLSLRKLDFLHRKIGGAVGSPAPVLLSNVDDQRTVSLIHCWNAASLSPVNCTRGTNTQFAPTFSFLQETV